MQRREFVKKSAATLAVASLVPMEAVAGPKPSGPVNLLFLTADDMNYTMPGYMGNKLGLTPNLDALAMRSYLFANNRTVNPICQPSREAMTTGLIPQHSGALGFNPVYPGTPTLATLLKDRGYYMACIHKTEHHKPKQCYPWDAEESGSNRNPLVYEKAARDAIAVAQKQKKPWFVYVNCNDPHHPFYGSTEAASMDQHETGEYKIPHELTAADVECPGVLENTVAGRAEWARYCNNVQRLDITMGKVLKVLADSGQADNTVIIFTVDHGMPFPFSKATTFDNGTRVPALVLYPGMGAPRKFEAQTMNIDILPTLCDLMNLQRPAKLDGASWMPLIDSKKYAHVTDTAAFNREYTVTHINTVNSGKAFPMRAIQNDRYTLMIQTWADGKTQLHIEAMGNDTYPAMLRLAETDKRVEARMQQFVYGIPIAFYDRKTDPDQRTNVIAAPEHKEQVDKMKALLLAYMEQNTDPQLENYKLILAGKQALPTASSKARES